LIFSVIRSCHVVVRSMLNIGVFVKVVPGLPRM